MLLKSSDFINDDLNPESVFEDYNPELSKNEAPRPAYELELVLRKWYPVDRGRELRCFVRGNKLIGKVFHSRCFLNNLSELAPSSNYAERYEFL